MTTSDLEAAFKPGVPTAIVPQADVRLGAAWEILPHDRAALIVDCSGVDHVTRALWSGTTVFRLSSPALRKDIDAHAGKLRALKAWLNSLADAFSVARRPSASDQDKAAAAALIESAFVSDSFRLVGVWVLNVNALEADNRWHGEIECRVGIQEI
jgi:hypothetical protein